jgi:hypothetical protein
MSIAPGRHIDSDVGVLVCDGDFGAGHHRAVRVLHNALNGPGELLRARGNAKPDEQ